MKIRRLTIALGGSVALTLALAGPALAAPHAAAQHKRVTNCGNYFGLFTANGLNEELWIPTPITQYDPFIQNRTSYAAVRFCQDAGSFNGYNAGELQLRANGEFVSADVACDDIVDKSTQNQNGTVWGQENVGSDILWHSRYCDSPDFVMSADNTTGDHWKVKANGANGWYQKVDKL